MIGTTAPPVEDTVVIDSVVVEVPGTRVELGDGMGSLTVGMEALFPYQYEDPPRFLTHGDLAWPVGEHFISRGSRFVYWAIRFDDEEASPGWSMPLFFRWVDDGLYEEDGTIMLEAPSQVSEGMSTVYQGVGRVTPGFWRPGEYTVFLLDGEFNELMRHSFRVR